MIRHRQTPLTGQLIPLLYQGKDMNIKQLNTRKTVMKKTVVAIIFLFVVSTQAQDSPGLPAGEFTESQLAVAATYENYLTSLNGASISTTNLLDIDIFVK